MPATQRVTPPRAEGLYDPGHEHDACGVGFVVHIKGRASHDVVAQGLRVLRNLDHRGACGCDPRDPDDDPRAVVGEPRDGSGAEGLLRHGKQKGHTAIYRGKEYNVSLLPKMEIELVVEDAATDAAVRAIIEAARTGEIGDGRVFVLPVTAGYRIRTGEQAM